jgi:hypothetical protein
MDGEIALGMKFERRWLTCTTRTAQILCFEERPSVIQFARGAVSIFIGVLFESVSYFYLSLGIQQSACIAPIIFGAYFILGGLNLIFPRRGFSFDASTLKIRVWGLRIFYRHDRCFDTAEFCRIRVTASVVGDGYPISLVNRENAVLQLARPDFESEAVALTRELADRLNIPICSEVHKVGSGESFYRTVRSIVEKELFRCN